MQDNCVLILDSNHTILYMNDAAKRVYPYEKDRISWISTASITWEGKENCIIKIGILMEQKQSGADEKADKKTAEFQNRIPALAGYDVIIELKPDTDEYSKMFRHDGKTQTEEGFHGIRQMLENTADLLVHPKDQKRFLKFWEECLYSENISEESESRVGEFRERCGDGAWDLVRIVVTPSKTNTDGNRSYMALFSVISGKNEGASLLSAKFTNGNEFTPSASQYLETVKENGCLIQVGINHMWLFIKRYGVEAGDRLLAAIGEFLYKTDEMYDSLSGYIGSNRFATVCAYSQEIVDNITEGIAKLVEKFAGDTEIRPVFGGCTFKASSGTFRSMRERALTAEVQRTGRLENGIYWYDEGILAGVEEELVLLSEARRGIKNNEFFICVQPKYSISRQEIVGAEALVRWNHPTRGIISPSQFVPLLEKRGGITMLDKYVWEEVFRTVSKWISDGKRVLPISVNVSRADFYVEDVPEFFHQLSIKYQVDPKYVQIEITETAFAESEILVRDAEQRFRAYGFTILIDDFGKGSSSLNMLKEIQADILKLDTRFLRMNDENMKKGLEIIKSIVDLAHTLQILVIAEGVENEKEKDSIFEMGCDLVQGYYYYKPMGISEYESVLN